MERCSILKQTERFNALRYFRST